MDNGQLIMSLFLDKYSVPQSRAGLISLIEPIPYLLFPKVEFQQAYAKEVDCQHPKDDKCRPPLLYPAVCQCQDQHDAHQRYDKRHSHRAKVGFAGL